LNRLCEPVRCACVRCGSRVGPARNVVRLTAVTIAESSIGNESSCPACVRCACACRRWQV
jgi:hypothetical protein